MEVIKDQLRGQAIALAAKGYAKELGVSDDEYVDEWDKRISGFNEAVEGLMPVLVEPRVDFRRQIEMWGVDLDPAVYTFPKKPCSGPYIALCKLVSAKEVFEKNKNLKGAVDSLSGDYLPATPFEGILASDEILEHGFAVFPGGQYKGSDIYDMPLRVSGTWMCLDRYLGRPRITQVDSTSTDGVIGILVARRVICQD